MHSKRRYKIFTGPKQIQQPASIGKIIACWYLAIAITSFMYVNLTFGKFALILCNVNFRRVVNVHR